ncbi:serine/threonine kinase [Aureococcus anophagefferens]|nr:serine/threonine kinase [Aureococcus anophagefferens]
MGCSTRTSRGIISLSCPILFITPCFGNGLSPGRRTGGFRFPVPWPRRVLDVREIATLVTTLYADRLPASSSSSGVPAVRSSTGVSESSEEHGVVLIRDSSLKSDEAWTERGCSFGSGASGSTSAVPRCGTDGSLGLGAPSPERHGVGGGLAAARASARRGPRGAASRSRARRRRPSRTPGGPRRASASVACELGRTIGRGASSTVAEATRRRDGVRVAVKVVAPARAAGLADAREEVRMHRLASGLPGVVELLDVFFEDGILYLVQELCAGGELFETIARGDTRVLGALAALHDVGVVHRDVKLENILLRSPGSRTDVVLADLGIAARRARRRRPADEPRRLRALPVARGRAPGALRHARRRLGPRRRARAAHGRLPFGRSAAALFDDIERGDVDFETPEMRRVSPGGRAAVARMLARPGDRRRDAPRRAVARGRRRDRRARREHPQLRAFLSWRATWRRSVHAIRAVNILASPFAALRTIAARPSYDSDAPTPRAPPTPAPSPLRSASPAPVETNVPDNVD